MDRPLLGVVTLLEDYYVPFSTLILKKGTKIHGYYDNSIITFFNNNVCYQYPLMNIKHQFTIENN